jgi:hypothetical protein
MSARPRPNDIPDSGRKVNVMPDEPKWQLQILSAANRQTEERLATPTDPLDLKYNSEPVCPHCGCKKKDAWEINFGDDLEGSTETTCDGCEEEFRVERNVEVTYTTSKIQPKG